MPRYLIPMFMCLDANDRHHADTLAAEWHDLYLRRHRADPFRHPSMIYLDESIPTVQITNGPNDEDPHSLLSVDELNLMVGPPGPQFTEFQIATAERGSPAWLAGGKSSTVRDVAAAQGLMVHNIPMTTEVIDNPPTPEGMATITQALAEAPDPTIGVADPQTDCEIVLALADQFLRDWAESDADDNNESEDLPSRQAAFNAAEPLIHRTPALDAVVNELVEQLGLLGFGDDNAEINGGDAVDVINALWEKLVAARGDV